MSRIYGRLCHSLRQFIAVDDLLTEADGQSHGAAFAACSSGRIVGHPHIASARGARVNDRSRVCRDIRRGSRSRADLCGTKESPLLVLGARRESV